MTVCHGGNVYAAARTLGRPVSRILDFSASINPLGPSPRACRAMIRGARCIQHYPDPDCTVLREALSRKHQCRPEHVVIGNGSSELIHLLPVALAIRRALVVGPTFEEYARAIHRHGGQVVRIQASRKDAYRVPLPETIERLQRARGGVDAVFVCNPNSPTGQSVASVDVRALLQAAQRTNAWVVLDETFIEYCEDRSALPLATAAPRALVLRSFTKFYALPGLRIGYAVGTKEAARRLHDLQPPWAVNALAQVAAHAALTDHGHARRSLALVARERARLSVALAAFPGVTVYPSSANFLLVELPRGTAAGTVVAALRRKGLLVRDCSSFQGLGDRAVRMAVRTPGENRRLVAALQGIFG